MSHPPRLTRRRLLIGVIVVAIVAAMLPVLITSFQKSRTLAQRNSCVMNMQLIYSATISLALENRYYRGDPVPPQQVAGVLRGNAIPVCPASGIYTLPVVMQSPVCSFHGPLFSEADLIGGPLSDKEKAVRERPKE